MSASLKSIVDWLDAALDVRAFSDVSNNGLQIAREGERVDKVAFGVDASVRTVKAAAAAGAQLLVVHHGISWGGGIQRLTGGVYNVVKAAMDANLALYAVHLPLDANHKYGNNYELARFLGLKNLKPAFVYHGETIAAENVGMPMICAGHYQTETFGVKALARAMPRALKVSTQFIPREEEAQAAQKEKGE